MPDFIVNAISDAVDALPSAGIAGAVAMAFGMPFLPAFGTALVLGGLSRALAPKPPSPPSASSLSSAGGSGSLVTIRQAISYWQIIYGRRRVSGVMTYAEISADNQKLWMVITLAGHVSHAIESILFEDEEVPLDGSGNATGRFAGYVRIFKSLGDEAGQPFPALVAGSAGKWTDAHRQTGRTKIAIELTFNQDVFPSGLPNITAIVQGVCDIYDSRTALRGYSTNFALCQANYLENAAFGFGATLTDEVNLAQLTTAANDADVDVPLDAGGTEKRYALNMVFTVDAQPQGILEAMINAGAGRTSQVGDTWYIFAGVYEAPAVTLTQSDLAGAIRSQTLVSMDENANGVKGTVTDPSQNWQTVDVPALKSSTYLAEDNGVQRWRQMALEQTVTSPTQAQRLFKIELLRTRQGETFAAPFKLNALKVIAGGTVGLTLDKYGYAAKAFEVTSFAFVISDTLELTIRLGLRETAAAIFDWATSEEQAVDIAPNTNLPDPFSVGVPGAPMITESLYSTLDGGGVKSKALVAWAASADKMAAQYQLRYKLAADADLEANWTTRAPVTSLSETLFDLAPNTYDFAVRAINFYSVRSAWSTTRKEIIGLSAAPADVTGLSIQAAGGLAILRWDLHPDLFVREGGWITFRHSEATDAASATWEGSFSIGEAVPGNNNQAALPLKPGCYLAKAMSQAEVLSVNAAKIATKQATALNFVDVSTLQEDSTFSGIHSNTTAPDGLLKLSSTTLIDSIPDFDSIVDFDSLGGALSASGTYTFAAGLDLGSVQRVRLTSKLVGVVSNTKDKIDARSGNIDDWADFDGNAGASADAYIEVQETDSDPAGSPTWSAWKRLDSGEFQARGFEFRAQLLSADPAYNVALSQVRVTAAQIY